MRPDDPDTIFAATSDGIFLSTDAGATWSRRISCYFKDIEVNPADASVWYATRSYGGVYRSHDCGLSWTRPPRPVGPRA